MKSLAVGDGARPDVPDAATAEPDAAGGRVSDAAPIGGSRQGFLADPDGNSVEPHETAWPT
jgi:hypothetical protein